MAGAIVRPGTKTTSAKAAEAVKQAQVEKEAETAGATQTERAKNPGVVKSKNFDMRDPSTGIYLPAGKLTEIPYFSGWMISQIDAGIIELIDGNPNNDRASTAPAKTDVPVKNSADLKEPGTNEPNPNDPLTGPVE
jgi:hypothetical protein